ncbi:MAG TPA: MFS transporter [Clostridiaceae bacterium]|nr:MFS transporter [Clostridiaceae bacterium]
MQKKYSTLRETTSQNTGHGDTEVDYSVSNNGLSYRTVQSSKNIFDRIPGRFCNIHTEQLAIFLTVAITLLGDSSLYVLLPTYVFDLGIPVAAVGVILSLNRFVRIITNYYAKYLYSYFGRRRLFIYSVILSAITTLFYGLPVGVVILGFSRLIWGGCWSAMRLVSFESIAENSNDNNRGTLTGLFHSIARIGSLLAIFLGGILSNYLGYRNTYYIFAFMTFIIGVPLSFYGMSIKRSSGNMQISEQTDERATEQTQEQMTEQTPVQTTEQTTVRETGVSVGNNENTYNHVKSKVNISLKLTYFMTFLNSWVGNGLLVSTIGYILLLIFGKEVTLFNITIGVSIAASFLVSVRWFYDIFLSVIFGKLADRFGYFKIIIMNCILQIISLLIIAYTQSFILIFLAAIVGFGGVTALTSTLDASAIGYQSLNKDKNILGHFTTWQDLGAAFGSMAGYSLVIAVGYSRAYMITALMIVLAIAFAIINRKRNSE